VEGLELGADDYARHFLAVFFCNGQFNMAVFGYSSQCFFLLNFYYLDENLSPHIIAALLKADS
jgi:hypothetical protein